ncbi:hypothetical protein [Actinokineospora sp. HUAS TT18]|uniref:hypothetical protein n=1 Tax=Actinokineospora sp. HUAS TT18 TaxID=3447451 RepID=UPI003F5260D0
MIDETAAVALLRGFAGRVRDSALNHLRGLLAAGELDLLESELVTALALDRVPVLPGELEDTDGLVVGTDLPRYDFAAAEPEPADQAAVAGVFGIEDVRTIRKALRISASGATALVWVVELAAGSDVSRWRRYLPDLSAFPDSTCEIVAEGERLPPYQAAALAAGLVVFSAQPGR